MEALTSKTKDYTIKKTKPIKPNQPFGSGKQRPLDPMGIRKTTKQYCIAQLSSTQSIASSATQTQISFDSYTTNNNSMEKDRGNAITIQKDGIYMITLMISWQSNSSSYRNGQIKINGSATIQGKSYRMTTPASIGASTTHSFVMIYRGRRGDYIEAVCAQESGSSINIDTTYTGLEVHEL